MDSAGVNQFGRVSELRLTAASKDGRTIVEDVFFTAPYKIMKPFVKPGGAITVMLLAASAGIMEGDRQHFDFNVKQGADLEFTSQSYDKIHDMKSGCAKRHTVVRVESGASFSFNPQPTIPFAGSAFENSMDIHLADETAKFQLSEIFSCGRYARGEKFAYRRYYNLVNIHRGGKLIYRDNTRYEPAVFDMAGMGMYEGYTHQANVFISVRDGISSAQEDIHRMLAEREDAEGDVTELAQGDIAVRIFARRAQILENIVKSIFDVIK